MIPLLARHLMPFSERMLTVFPVLIIQGARRVGKSTFAAMLAEGKQHVSYTLDDDDVRSQAVNDPRTLVTQAGDGLLVIDEVQRAPELLLAIKAEVDRNPQPGRFVLTGSSDLLRLPHTPDSLAGRAVTLPLWGLSAGELAGAPDDFAAFVLAGHDWHGFTTSWSRDDYATALCCGSYPEAMRLEPADRSVWLRSYLDRLLRRDVPNVGRAIPAARLRTMLRLLAANPSGELVLARLADQLAVTAPTVRDHIELLEAMYLVQSLPPWTANLTKREVGRNKTSVCDAGLATQLTRATPAKLTSPALAEHFGALLESFVTMELIKQQTWTTAPFELFHFRDRNGPEVDIVMEFADGEVFLIEVKASQSYRSDYFTHMKKLAASIGNRCLGGVVLGTAPYAFRHADKFWGLPISALWESVP